MCKKLLAIITLIFFVACQSNENYTSQKLGIKFVYPASWTIVDENERSVSFLSDTQHGDAGILIEAILKPSEMTAEDILEEKLIELISQDKTVLLSEVIYTENSDFAFDNKTAYFEVLPAPPFNDVFFKMKAYRIVFKQGENVILISIAGDGNEPDRVADIARQIRFLDEMK